MTARREINPTLLKLAEWRLNGEHEKAAFVPTDPAAAGGAPPMDPAMMGGMPPGMPPGGAPPMDPAMMGGMPPGGAPPMDPSMMGMAPPAAPGAAPGAPGAPGKAKIDPAFIYMELGRVRKLLTHLFKHVGVELPPDILDDSSVAQVMAGAQPQSAPLGQGPSEGAPPAGGAGGGELPGIGNSAALGPISAPGEKAGADTSEVIRMFREPDVAESTPAAATGRIDALAALSRSRATHDS